MKRQWKRQGREQSRERAAEHQQRKAEAEQQKQIPQSKAQSWTKGLNADLENMATQKEDVASAGKRGMGKPQVAAWQGCLKQHYEVLKECRDGMEALLAGNKVKEGVIGTAKKAVFNFNRDTKAFQTVLKAHNDSSK